MATPRKVRRYNKRQQPKALHQETQAASMSLLTKVFVFAAIALFLYVLATCGGNGADWYPGKPLHLR